VQIGGSVPAEFEPCWFCGNERTSARRSLGDGLRTKYAASFKELIKIAITIWSVPLRALPNRFTRANSLPIRSVTCSVGVEFNKPQAPEQAALASCR
jgi:hypothetical protein